MLITTLDRRRELRCIALPKLEPCNHTRTPRSTLRQSVLELVCMYVQAFESRKRCCSVELISATCC